MITIRESENAACFDGGVVWQRNEDRPSVSLACRFPGLVQALTEKSAEV